MIREIKKQLEQFHMIETGDRILIGISGGADSICLGEVLYRLKDEFSLELGAVYCHHGIRGKEADEDGNFVKDFCQKRGISYYEASEKVEERAKMKKISVEEAGREFRYETFGKIMEREGFFKLAVAHNANDRAETMLFHLARGTGLAGLCTMEAVREFSEGKRLIRPLLWTERSQIEQWLLGEGISWRTDSTNLLDIYTRNRIRHQVLPALKNINERAVFHMGEAAQTIGEAFDYLRQEVGKMEDFCIESRTNESIIVDIPRFNLCHVYMKKAVLYQLLTQISGCKRDISSVHVEKLLDLAEGETGRQAVFSRGVYGRKEYNKLLLFTKKGQEGTVTEADLDHIRVHMERIAYEGQEILKNKYTKYFDCDKIKDNLVLRHWKEGDYFYLREEGGKKKLSRYFIDEKISQEERRRIPLLADGNHVLWVIGHRISAYYKVTDKTKNILIINVENKG